jgi:hypothetical protein
MAAGDFAQMLLCAWLLHTGRAVPVNRAAPAPSPAATAVPAAAGAAPARRALLGLCAVVMAFDFCAYLVRPFFSLHWEQVSGSASQLLAGLVFAIPGAVALVALVVNQRAKAHGRALLDQVPGNLVLARSACCCRRRPRCGPHGACVVRLGAVPADREARGAAVPNQHAGVLCPRLQHLQFLPEPGRAAGLVRRGALWTNTASP